MMSAAEAWVLINVGNEGFLRNDLNIKLAANFRNSLPDENLIETNKLYIYNTGLDTPTVPLEGEFNPDIYV